MCLGLGVGVRGLGQRNLRSRIAGQYVDQYLPQVAQIYRYDGPI